MSDNCPSGCDPHLCTSERRASPAQTMTLHVGRTAGSGQRTADASVIMIMSRMAAPERGGTIRWDCTDNDSARRSTPQHDGDGSFRSIMWAPHCRQVYIVGTREWQEERERERGAWERVRRAVLSVSFGLLVSKQEQRVCAISLMEPRDPLLLLLLLLLALFDKIAKRWMETIIATQWDWLIVVTVTVTASSHQHHHRHRHRHSHRLRQYCVFPRAQPALGALTLFTIFEIGKLCCGTYREEAWYMADAGRDAVYDELGASL